jgi:hypothetical protein
MEELLDRKRFVKVATAAAGALSFGLVADRAGATDADSIGPFRGALQDGTAVLSGVIDRVDGSEIAVQGPEPDLRIRVGRKTTVWRDAPVDIAELRQGDYISAVGKWTDSETFVASEVAPTYFNLAGQIKRVDANVLATSGGAAQITNRTRVLTRAGALLPIAEATLREGSSISMMARRQSGGSPEYVAVRVHVG